MAYQFGAVVDGAHVHAGRQALVERGHGLLDVGHHLRRVATLAHLDRAFDHAGLLVERHHAGARPEAGRHRAQVGHQHSAAVAGADHHLTDLARVGKDADAAHQQRLVAAPHQAAADVGAIGGQGGADLVQRDAVAAQCTRVDLDLVFLDGAAKTDHVRHAVDDAQLRPYHPVLQRAHFVHIHAGRRLDDVAEYFANGGGQRRQRRLHAGRQGHVLQLFQHLLAREIVVGAVSEGQRHHRQGADGDRAQLRLARHAAHLALDRQGDGTLDLLRRLARILGDDLHLYVLHVGKGLDRQVAQRAPAESGQCQRQDQHEYALRQDEIDQLTEHARCPRRSAGKRRR